MPPSDDDTRVYLVPIIDVNWLTFAPFDPARGFRIDPPDVEQSLRDLDLLIGEMSGLTDGKFVLTPHSGTYCRTAYYEGEMLDLYARAVAGGGEVAIHLHEEIKGAGTRFGEEAHVTAMFRDCHARLTGAGLQPLSYRGGHTASVGKSQWLERYRRFLGLVPQRGGQFITSHEARLLFDRFGEGSL